MGFLSTGLGIASGLMGGGGGGKSKSSVQSVSAFDTLPKKGQELYNDLFFPAVRNNFNAGFQSVPMQRVDINSNDPFRSQGLIDFQKYSDMMGGYFSPLEGILGGGIPGGGAGSAMDPETQKRMEDDLRAEMIGRQVVANMSNRSGLPNMGQQRGSNIYGSPYSAVPGATTEDYILMGRQELLSPADRARLFSSKPVNESGVADLFKGIDKSKVTYTPFNQYLKDSEGKK
jgi:hypothetical protein